MRINFSRVVFTFLASLMAFACLMMFFKGGGWLFPALNRTSNSLSRSATDPVSFFRSLFISLQFEADTQIVHAGPFAKLYFLGVLLTLLLVMLFVAVENQQASWRRNGLLLGFLVVMLFPMALANFAYGKYISPNSAQLLAVAALLVLAVFTLGELVRNKPGTLTGKMLQVLIVLALVVEGIFVPALLGMAIIGG